MTTRFDDEQALGLDSDSEHEHWIEVLSQLQSVINAQDVMEVQLTEILSAVSTMLEFLVEAKTLMDNSPALKLRRALSGKPRPVV